MEVDEIGKFLNVTGKNWHKTTEKTNFLKGYQKLMKGDKNADFWIDKNTKNVLLRTNKSDDWIDTGIKFE